MKRLTKKDYINEILRFARILTQLKYEKDFDKSIKKLLCYNLEAVEDQFNLNFRGENQKYLTSVICLCKTLVRADYASAQDLSLKESLARALADLSKYEVDRAAKLHEKRANDYVAKFLAALR